MTEMTGNVTTALSAPVLRPERFVEIQFVDRTVDLWSGMGNYTLGNTTYLGLGFPGGSLGSVDVISDIAADGQSEFNSQRVQMTLSGIDTVFASEYVQIDHAGAPVKIMEALFDGNRTLVADAYVLLNGNIDTMAITVAQTLTITVQCENFISFMFRTGDGRRRSAADQTQLFSGDNFYSFDTVQTAYIPWAIPGAAGQSSVPVALQGTAIGGAFQALHNLIG